MIHIPDTSAPRAAQALARIIESHGGNWLVNAVEDEGFIAAHFDSPDGQQLLRSGSQSLAGPFNAQWNVEFIVEDLKYAKSGKCRTKSKYKARVETVTKRIKVLRVLQRGPSTCDRISKATGLNRDTVRWTLRKMIQNNTARRTSVSRENSGGYQHMYEVVV